MSVCLSGIMMAVVLDPFLTDLSLSVFMKERDPFEYLLPGGGTGWTEERWILETSSRSPNPPQLHRSAARPAAAAIALTIHDERGHFQ